MGAVGDGEDTAEGQKSAASADGNHVGGVFVFFFLVIVVIVIGGVEGLRHVVRPDASGGDGRERVVEAVGEAGRGGDGGGGVGEPVKGCHITRRRAHHRLYATTTTRRSLSLGGQ